MFPTIKIELKNCDHEMYYYVYLDIVPVDTKRYRYVYNNSSWSTSGKAEQVPPKRFYLHPDSPFSGSQV